MLIYTGLLLLFRLMKNAFDPAEETERDWDVELRDDVKGEVEEKYGKVADIFILKDSKVSATRFRL